VKVIELSLEEAGPTNVRISVTVCPLVAAHAVPRPPSKAVSHCAVVVRFGPFAQLLDGVAGLQSDSRNWSWPGVVVLDPVQLLPPKAVLPPHSVQWVTLSAGIASAPWTSMWPAACPFVIVMLWEPVVMHDPFGNRSAEPVGFPSESRHVSKVVEAGATATERTATLIVAVVLSAIAGATFSRPRATAAVATAVLPATDRPDDWLVCCLGRWAWRLTEIVYGNQTRVTHDRNLDSTIPIPPSSGSTGQA
jgi:hypothetical protein